jgi:hypothetical protein
MGEWGVTWIVQRRARKSRDGWRPEFNHEGFAKPSHAHFHAHSVRHSNIDGTLYIELDGDQGSSPITPDNRDSA